LRATVNNINIKNDITTYDPSLERKIDLITEGLSHQYADRLYKIRKDNALSIVSFEMFEIFQSKIRDLLGLVHKPKNP
jgi:hypothetical protein